MTRLSYELHGRRGGALGTQRAHGAAGGALQRRVRRRGAHDFQKQQRATAGAHQPPLQPRGGFGRQGRLGRGEDGAALAREAAERA
jgi:hypothetical protein